MLPSFTNDAVLITNAYNGSTPLYAALSFLQSHDETATVIIYTPDTIDIEDGLDDDETTRPVDTKLKADEWFLENGLRGSTAALLDRIQIIRVDSLAQLAICLAVYPSAQLGQEATTGNVMIILHDITLLPNHSSEQEQDHSIPPFTETPFRMEIYLMVVTHALSAKLTMTGQQSKVVLFECRFDTATRTILQQYLVEESLPYEVTNNL